MKKNHILEKYYCSRCGVETLPTINSVNIDGIVLCMKCSDLFAEETNLLHKFYCIPPLMVDGVKKVLEGLRSIYPDLNLESQHMKQTPARVARMFVELCSGLGQDPKRHLETAFVESNYGGIVLVKNIQFVSLCMHHLVPFRGVAHVGYIPEGKIVGLSKINRVVEILAARPQVQERLTRDVVHVIQNTLEPKGVMGVFQARHDCIEIRGVKSKGSSTMTSELTGIFIENSKNCKDEFLGLISEDLSKI